MWIAWISMREAKRFIREHHRHRPHIQGGIVALGLWTDRQLRGVAIIGRAARMDSPDLCCITRLCTDGCRNACSKLYSKAKRLGQALGFVGIKTFTLEVESDASLLAVGAVAAGRTKGEHWGRTSRPRNSGDNSPKKRWIL